MIWKDQITFFCGAVIGKESGSLVSDGMQIQYKRSPRWQRFLTTICTLGISMLFVRLAMKSRPTELDEQGIQLHNGRKIDWAACKTLTSQIATREDLPAERLLLRSDSGTIPFNFDQMFSGDEVREFLCNHVLPGFELVDETDRKIDDEVLSEAASAVEIETGRGFELLEPGSEESC